MSALGNLLLTINVASIVAAGVLVVGLRAVAGGDRDAALCSSASAASIRFPRSSVPGPRSVMGMAFAFGWTPCVGPVLGGVLGLAAARATLASGVVAARRLLARPRGPLPRHRSRFRAPDHRLGRVRRRLWLVDIVAGSRSIVFGALLAHRPAPLVLLDRVRRAARHRPRAADGELRTGSVAERSARVRGRARRRGRSLGTAAGAPVAWAAAMAPAVLLRTAVALTGRFPALAGVDLAVDQGEVVVLTGPNGAGKTSVLRVCAGLLRVTGGEAQVLGHDLRRDGAGGAPRVAMLGHAAALYDDLTVSRTSASQCAPRVPSLRPSTPRSIVWVSCGRLRRSPVGRLSAGQRRRVALAVLVARRPELWLLDEPHAALDAAARAVLGEARRPKPWPTAPPCSWRRTSPRSRWPFADRVVVPAGRVVATVGPAERRRCARHEVRRLWCRPSSSAPFRGGAHVA